jgi:hypothetical protein
MLRSDPTQFSKLATYFHKAVIHLLSQHEVTGISKVVLDAFHDSYASTAFCCRYPHCYRSSAGFASLHLRTQHEMTHLKRVYCNDETCRFSNIGFANRSALNAHTRKYHDETTVPPIPAKVRRSENSSLYLGLDFGDDIPLENFDFDSFLQKPGDETIIPPIPVELRHTSVNMSPSMQNKRRRSTAKMDIGDDKGINGIKVKQSPRVGGRKRMKGSN